MNAKKRRERVFLDHLLRALGAPRPSTITPGERPDFHLVYENESVGVEVTQLFRSPTEPGSREWEGTCNAVLEAARRALEAERLPPRHFSVTFDKRRRFRKADYSASGQLLANVARQMIDDPRPNVVAGIGAGPYHSITVELPAGVQIMIMNETQRDTSWWTPSTGGAVGEIDPKIIAAAIAGKEGSLAAYRQVAPKVWLILGLDDFTYSGMMQVDGAPALDRSFSTAFDRVFLVPRSGPALWELDCI
jgi:hypothetical protein